MVDLKQEHGKAVNCLLEGRDFFFSVMPTGCGKRFIFQLFATAMTIKKVRHVQPSDTVVLVTYANQHNSGSDK